MRAMRLVFLGAPGAGKGTQAKAFEEKFGLAQISTGDILRANVKNGSPLGLSAKSYMDAGGLVPDDVIIGMMESELAGRDSFILDGFPRTVGQAEALDALLLKLGKPLSAVVQFDAERSALIARLTGRWTNPRTGRTYHTAFNPPRTPGICDEDGGDLVQRKDDTYDVVVERLATYDEKTAPLVDYYARKGLLVRVDALKPIESVTAEILAGIEARTGAGAS